MKAWRQVTIWIFLGLSWIKTTSNGEARHDMIGMCSHTALGVRSLKLRGMWDHALPEDWRGEGGSCLALCLWWFLVLCMVKICLQCLPLGSQGSLPCGQVFTRILPGFLHQILLLCILLILVLRWILVAPYLNCLVMIQFLNKVTFGGDSGLGFQLILSSQRGWRLGEFW